MQSRSLLSLYDNRAYANRSQSLKSLSCGVWKSNVRLYSLRTLIHRNEFLPVHVLVSRLTFLLRQEEQHFVHGPLLMPKRCKGTTFSPKERNSLAENRVSLRIFNCHTWIEYENHTRKIRCYLHFCNESNRLDAISGFLNRIRLSSRERYPRILTLPYQMVLLSIMAA